MWLRRVGNCRGGSLQLLPAATECRLLLIGTETSSAQPASLEDLQNKAVIMRGQQTSHFDEVGGELPPKYGAKQSSIFLNVVEGNSVRDTDLH